jgi:Ca2+-transporting ATPase
VIATDKTGTITEGRMVVQRAWTPVGEATSGGTDYGLDTDVARNAYVVRAVDAADLSALLRAAALCTDATIHPPDPEHPEGQIMGDPTEAALIVAAEKLGLQRAALVDASPRVDEFPFDSLRKRMTTLHRQATGHLVICKGAPEFLLMSSLPTTRRENRPDQGRRVRRSRPASSRSRRRRSSTPTSFGR